MYLATSRSFVLIGARSRKRRMDRLKEGRQAGRQAEGVVQIIDIPSRSTASIYLTGQRSSLQRDCMTARTPVSRSARTAGHGCSSPSRRVVILYREDAFGPSR